MSVDQMVLLGTLLVLIYQVAMQRRDLRKGDYRYIYDRWARISEYEIQNPALHRLLYDHSFAKDLDTLDEEKTRLRALALLVLDQFALIFKTGDRYSVFTKYEGLVGPILARNRWLRELWAAQKERHKTVFEYNEDYIRGILCNPAMIRCWRDYKLGETWMGDEFYEYVNQVIREHETGQTVGIQAREAYRFGKGHRRAQPSERVAESVKPITSGHRAAAFVVLSAAAVVWGVGYSVVKNLVEVLDPVVLLAWRGGLAASVILISVRLSGRRVLDSRYIGPGVLLGSVLTAALIAQSEALETTKAATTGFISGLAVVFTPAFVWLFFHRIPHRLVFLAALVAMLGLFLLVGPDLAVAGTRGGLLALLGSVLLGLHIALTGEIVESRRRVLLLVGYQFGTMAVLSAVWIGPDKWGDLAQLQGSQWLWLLYVVVAVSVLGYFAQTFAQRVLSATVAAVILTLEPVSSAGYAAGVAGELLSRPQWAGGALLVLAVLMCTLAPTKGEAHSATGRKDATI